VVFSQNHVVVEVSDIKTGKGISYSLVQYRMENFKIICDESGRGVIPVQDSTLLKISAIGYEDYFHFIIHSEEVKPIQVSLKQKTYELNEFVVNPYPTRMLFKKAIADLDLPDTNMISPNLFMDPRLKEFSAQAKEYQGGDFVSLSLGSPISSIYNLVSKRAKSERKLKKLKWADNKSEVVAKKYNKAYVEQLLGIKELKRIEAFMEYCQPSYEFILASTDYELACYVMNCYQSFLLNEVDME
jgi:hypothetical protein